MNIYISVIVATYNWPSALKQVINSLTQQTKKEFEIVIADDGSTKETKNLIDKLKQDSLVPIKHVWQEDLGFRLARCRNLAIREAKGNYLVFLDGDCIVKPDFIENHQKLAESGYFVTGNRVLLNQDFTRKVLEKNLDVGRWSILSWLKLFLQRKCNRISPLLNLPYPRKMKLKKWQGAKGCNFTVFKSDLEKVNFWNEEFKGWGFEDSDLAIRLIKAGVKRKEGRFKVPVIHLWHKESDRSNAEQNWSKLMATKDYNNM